VEQDVELRKVPLGVKNERGEPAHVYEMLPQQHARIERQLIGKDGIFSDLEDLAQVTQGTEGAQGLDQLVGFLGDRVYDVLRVFIPDLMERWEFMGYGSQDAMERGEYVETKDASPTIPQINDALIAAVDVNGLRWVGRIKDLLDPQLVKQELNMMLARWVTQQQLTAAREEKPTSDTPSPSLPPQNGESALTSSGTSDPTPETPSEPASPSGSPFPGSAG
jgi:hypothetical protein